MVKSSPMDGERFTWTEHLQLADNHLKNDSSRVSLLWSWYHLKEAVTLLQESPDFEGSNPSFQQLIPTLINDKECQAPGCPNQKKQWKLRCLLHAESRRIYYRAFLPTSLFKIIPRFSRDVGVGLLTLLILFFFYLKYSGQSINLWSKQYSVMDVTIESASQGYGEVQLNKTVERQPVMIGGQYYEAAIGTHAYSQIDISFKHSGAFFSGICGYPDSIKGARIQCSIEVGDKTLWESEPLDEKNRKGSFKIKVTGEKKARLVVKSLEQSIAAAHAVWVDLKITDE